VDPYLAAFAEAGADHITIHVEAGGDIAASLKTIRALGKQAGLTLKPGTPVSALAPFVDLVDLVLVMSVEPGFGGQAFLPESIGRIAAVKALLGSRAIPIEVDGGISAANAGAVVAAGASALVAGNAVFKGDYATNIAAIRSAGANAA
jgi:ribulose-phosphate 3-epimerase